MSPSTLVCTPCGHPLGGKQHIAIFRTETGLRLEIGCDHRVIPDLESAVAVVGSGGCLCDWLSDWWSGPSSIPVPVGKPS
jgi:hypothetical protein